MPTATKTIPSTPAWDRSPSLCPRCAKSQVREVNGQGGGFYPQSLERGTRSERALKLALAEIYMQGVSTRKVAAITYNLNH